MRLGTMGVIPHRILFLGEDIRRAQGVVNSWTFEIGEADAYRRRFRGASFW